MDKFSSTFKLWKLSILLTTTMEISKTYPKNLYNLEKIIIDDVYSLYKETKNPKFFPSPQNSLNLLGLLLYCSLGEVMTFLIAQLASLRTQQNSRFSMQN